MAALAAWALKPAPPVTNVVTRFSYSLPDGVAFTRTGRRMLVISPDGTRIAFVANQRIYLRHLNELEAQPIRGSDIDPLDLAFSPDGQSIAFVQAGTGSTGWIVRRIDVVGGKAVQVCESPGASFGLEWSGDRIVFSTGNEILAVPATGGTPQVLVTSGKGATDRIAHPQFVAGGRGLIYTIGANAAVAKIVVQHPIESATPRVLVDGGTDGRVLPTGHLVWVQDNALYAQPFDLVRLELTGGPVPLIEGIRIAGGTGTAQLAISDTGTMVFTQDAGTQTANLLWVDRSGRVEQTGVPPRVYGYARLSPDGKKIVANTTDGDADMWLWDIERKTQSRLTSGPEVDNYPVWTGDSKFILYRSGAAGTGDVDLFRRAVDGTGDTPRISGAPQVDTPMAVLKDGRVLLRRTPNDTSPLGTLEILPLEAGARPIPVFGKQPAPIVNADLSPDGRWLAYQSSEGSTRDEIHVRPFPNVDSGHWQISSGLSSRPLWSKSAGNLELFYHAVLSGGISKLMRVTVPPIPAGAAFTFDAPQPLLDLSGYSAGALGRSWDISLDGKRFLMVKAVGAESMERNSLIVVTHWFDELKARSKPVR